MLFCYEDIYPKKKKKSRSTPNDTVAKYLRIEERNHKARRGASVHSHSAQDHC